MGEGRGVFTFFTALSHWPDRALVGGWGGGEGQRRVTKKEPDLLLCRGDTLAGGHLLHAISLKGHTGANQSSGLQLIAACTGCLGDLSSAGGLGCGLSLKPLPHCMASQLSVYAPQLPFPFPPSSTHMPHTRWQTVTGRSP